MTPPLNLVLLGAPGSGKGTQAEALEAELGLAHVASGDLFRENLERETPLGLRAKAYMDRGELVPDEVTTAMIRERFGRPDNAARGVVLDGFPRTLAQAAALDEILSGLGRQLHGVLYIDVPDQELIDRLAGRLICRVCQAPFHVTANPFKTCPIGQCAGEHLYRRTDDEPDTVRARLATFHRRTAPLVEHYRAAGLLVSVSGSGSVEQVRVATLGAANAFARSLRV